jgi:hypothetical protein
MVEKAQIHSGSNAVLSVKVVGDPMTMMTTEDEVSTMTSKGVALMTTMGMMWMEEVAEEGTAEEVVVAVPEDPLMMRSLVDFW